MNPDEGIPDDMTTCGSCGEVFSPAEISSDGLCEDCEEDRRYRIDLDVEYIDNPDDY